ncbi:MAG: DUF6449 domain-containing protein [Lachnospiraceae bacterium]|jgi:ABC-2 type transport system permease protein
MKSKISSVKLLREDSKRHLWIWALSFLGFFLIFPVGCLIELGNRMKWLEESVAMGEKHTIETVIDWYTGYLSYQNGFLDVLVVLLAVVAAVTCFYYLHSREKMDFYHSFPVRREKLFAVQYIQGILLFAVPYLLNLFVALLIGIVQGVLTVKGLGICLQAVFVYLVYYLLLYTVAVLAMMLTGKLLVGILGTAVFYLYGPAVWILCRNMKGLFYDTFSSCGEVKTWEYLSPLTNYSAVVSELSDTGNMPWMYLAGAVIFWIIFTCLAIVLYRRRSSEAAERAMAFAKTESVIKVLLIIPASLAGGILISDFSENAADAWFVFGIAFCLLLGNGIVEFIYHMDFRELFSKKKSLALSFVLAFALFLMYRFDLTGYDAYIPEQDKIEQMSVFNSNLMDDNSYPWNGDYNYGPEAALSYIRVNDYEALYNLAKTARNVMLSDEKESLAEGNPSVIYDTVYVRYYLKNGREVERCYIVPEDSIYASMEKVYENKEFRQKAVPGQYIVSEEACGLEIGDITQDTYIVNSITPEQIAELMAVYQEEAAAIPYAQLVEKAPVASFEIEKQYENYKTYQGYLNVYDTYTKTLEYLQNLWPEMKIAMQASDIEQIHISWENADTGDTKEITCSETSEIEEILAKAQFGIRERSRCYADGHYIYAEIYWKNANGSVSNHRLEDGELPEFVREAFGV